MKRFYLFVLLVTAVLTGCQSTDNTAALASEAVPQETYNLSEQEVLEKVAPYLDNFEYQNPEKYDSVNDFYKANLGLDESLIDSAVLYMGAPNNNTGYFLMLTKKPQTDTALIQEKLTDISVGWIKTAEQGYLEGNRDFATIQKGNVFFLVSHYNPEKYTELVSLLENL